jgi:hypothetical protein
LGFLKLDVEKAGMESREDGSKVLGNTIPNTRGIRNVTKKISNIVIEDVSQNGCWISVSQKGVISGLFRVEEVVLYLWK